MKILAAIFLVAFLCGCSGPERVSPKEFEKQYAWVGQLQTMQNVTYLGQRGGRAYIKISSMSVISREWSDHVIYVELANLDPAFRDILPRMRVDGK